MKITMQEVVAAVLCSPTNAAAAEMLDISESYLYKLMKNPEFDSLYHEAQGKIFELCLERIKRGLSASVEVMLTIIEDEDVAPQIRLNAAEALQRAATRFYQAAQDERIDRLLPFFK